MNNDIFNIAGKLINEINDIKDNTEKKKEIKKEFIERAQNYLINSFNNLRLPISINKELEHRQFNININNNLYNQNNNIIYNKHYRQVVDIINPSSKLEKLYKY